MFRKSAHIYDAIYSKLDYPGQTERVHGLIQKRSPGAKTLLDVACGTGLHLSHFRRWYEVEGLDLDPGMLAIARDRLGKVPLHEADMSEFDLGRKFDVVTCLFSSIGYMQSTELLDQAVMNMAKHLKPGGVLVVEPWITPDKFLTVEGGDYISADFVDEPELKIARMGRSRVEDRTSVLEMHYLVNTPKALNSFTETHRLYLFTDQDYRTAFERAGLKVHHDPVGLLGRGLLIGEAP